MALRATNGPSQSTRSVKVGERVEFTAKVENTASPQESVALTIEDSPHTFAIEPAAHDVPGKSRRPLSWSWTATLPDDKPALTFRGKLVLRRVTDGALVGSAPLDVYVSRV